jgi:hypothetical protein
VPLYAAHASGLRQPSVPGVHRIEVQPPTAAADRLRSAARLYVSPTHHHQQQQEQRQQRQASPASPSVASARPGPAPSQRHTHGIGSAPTLAFPFSEAQSQGGDSLGGRSAAVPAAGKRPGAGGPASSAAVPKAAAAPALKRQRMGRVDCSQAGPAAAGPTQAGQQGMDLGKRPRRIIEGVTAGSQYVALDVEWALKQLRGCGEMAEDKVMQLVRNQLSLLYAAVDTLAGMGYERAVAEAAAKEAWARDLPESQLVQRAVEKLLGGK